MIKMQRTHNRTDIAFYCDICTERIADARRAVALYRIPASAAEEFVDMAHVHKGDCLKAAKIRWGRSQPAYYEEMLAHVGQLVFSLGLTSAALQEWEDENLLISLI